MLDGRYPVVVATPTEESKNNSTFVKTPAFRMEDYHFGDRVFKVQKRTSHLFYWNFKNHQKKQFMDYKFRNQLDMKWRRLAIGIDGDNWGKGESE